MQFLLATGRKGFAQEIKLQQWFAARGWKPFAFQKDVWTAVKDGRSGFAITGGGEVGNTIFHITRNIIVTKEKEFNGKIAGNGL